MRGFAEEWRRRYGDPKLEELPIPVGVVVTRWDTGRAELWTEGSAWRAVRASIAVPALVEPLRERGASFVDGGLAEPLPAPAARKWFPHAWILAVDVLSHPGCVPALHSWWDAWRGIVPQYLRALSRWNAREADYVLVVPLEGYSWLDFGRAEEIIRIGRQAVLRVREEVFRGISV